MLFENISQKILLNTLKSIKLLKAFQVDLKACLGQPILPYHPEKCIWLLDDDYGPRVLLCSPYHTVTIDTRSILSLFMARAHSYYKLHCGLQV